LAAGSEETREARANSLCVITQTSSRAISARLITIAVDGILARGALLQIASRAAVTSIAKATYVLHGIPRLGVDSANLGSQMLLRPASATVVAVAGTNSSLTGDTLVAWETVAGTDLSVAKALVGAFRPRRQVISILNRANPSKILGACS